MKKTIIIAVTLVLSFFSANSFASCTLYYASGNLGLTLMDDMDLSQDNADGNISFASVFNFAGAFGVIKENWRFEAEIRHQRGDIDNYSADGGLAGDGDFSLWGLFGNVYYDFDFDSNFVPYIGAGIGIVRPEFSELTTKTGVKLTPENDGDSLFGLQAGLGVAYIINDNFMLDFGYHYMHTIGDFPGSNNFTLGLRYVF